MKQPIGDTVVRFNFPTTVFCGKNSSAKTPDVLREQGLKKPLLVSDSILAKLPVFHNFCENLASNQVNPSVYSSFSGNPVSKDVVTGVAAFRSNQCDSIIAFGGGAAIDVAKAIALMVNHPGNVFDYEDDKPGALPVNQPIPYLIAIPTTAGTGSEVGRSSVISDDITHEKKIIFDPKLLPKIVFLDPMLSVGLPPLMTAATGIDALTHLVEAYLVDSFHPMADGIALEGIRLVGENLPDCVSYANSGVIDALHISARTQMLCASMMGAVSFQKGLGVVHSCAHALSAILDMHHGMANAIMMPVCMDFNRSVSEAKIREIERVLGVNSISLSDHLKLWNQQFGIWKALDKTKFTEANIEKLVDVAFRDVCHLSNPRKVQRDDFYALFKKIPSYVA